jgi:uncharacterized protein YdbL (DUF1318 family)
VASTRTTLENQIIGSYQELDSDYVSTASVRAVDSDGNTKKAPVQSDYKQRALAAKQNMEFNRDDLEELLSEEYIGEKNDGSVDFLPVGIGRIDTISKERRKFAQAILAEENRDRDLVWRRIVEQSPHLGPDHISAVKSEFAKMQREALKSGHWFQTQNGDWVKK